MAPVINQQKFDLQKSRFDQQFKIVDNLIQEMQSHYVERFKNYPRKIKEFREYAEKTCFYSKQIERIKEKINALNTQNEKISQDIQDLQQFLEILKIEFEKDESELNNKEKVAKDLDATFDFLGLQINHREEENVYNVRLSKLPIQNYDVIFCFDIYHDQKTTKILCFEPENCIDTEPLLQKIQSSNDNMKIFDLILLIRQELIKKYSSKNKQNLH